MIELGPRANVERVPLAGSVEAVTIHSRSIRVPGAWTFVAIDATGKDDVWLLGGGLFRVSGGVAVRQRTPCEGEDFSPSQVRVSATHVVLAGATTTETPGVPRVDATYAEIVRGGSSRCLHHPAPVAYAWQIASTVIPGAAWAHGPDLGRWTSWSSDGGAIALPDLQEGSWPAIWHMVDARRGWVTVGTRDADVCASTYGIWENRGAGWVTRPGLEEVCLADVWVDPQGGAWFVGSVMAVHRTDHWEVFELPEGFVATHVSGSGPGDVWLADETRLLHFDGRRFRSAAAPISRITDIRYVAGSGLWVVGGPEPAHGDEGVPRRTVGEVAIVTLAEAQRSPGAPR